MVAGSPEFGEPAAGIATRGGARVPGRVAPPPGEAPPPHRPAPGPASPGLRTDSAAPPGSRLRPRAPGRAELRVRGGMSRGAGVSVTASERAAPGLRA